MRREFGKSLKDKEQEIEVVDERILEVQKALHVVRYGCVTDFYARSVAKVRNFAPHRFHIFTLIKIKIIFSKRTPNRKMSPSTPPCAVFLAGKPLVENHLPRPRP